MARRAAGVVGVPVRPRLAWLFPDCSNHPAAAWGCGCPSLPKEGQSAANISNCLPKLLKDSGLRSSGNLDQPATTYRHAGNGHGMSLPGRALSVIGALRILETAFRTSFNEELFHWKVSRPGARLHLAEHATLTTLELPIPGMDAVTVYDWASTARGAGRDLYRQAIAGHTLISIGGTADSCRAKAKLGLQVVGSMYIYTRILRPRLARYVWDSVRGTRASGLPPRVQAEPVEQFGINDISGECVQCLWPQRTAEWVNSLLKCPVGSPRGFVLRNTQRALGYGVLMQFGQLCRIVDLRVASGDQADWDQAIAALVAVVERQPGTRMVRSAATCRSMASALTANGFWKGGRIRIYSKDALDVSNIHLTASDGDLLVL